MKFSGKRHRLYTLVELIVSLAIFALISTAVLRLYAGANKIWIDYTRKNEVYSNARIAMDLMAGDLQCALYNNDTTNNGIYPFWFRENTLPGCARIIPPKTDAKIPELDFIANTNFIPNISSNTPPDAKSRICEIKYTYLPYDCTATVTDPDGTVIPKGWLIRSATGDNAESQYNFIDCPNVNFGTYTVDDKRMQKIFADDDPSAHATPSPFAVTTSNAFQPVIPNVYELKFICYYNNNGTLTSFNPLEATSQYGTYFPVYVNIQLTLLDTETWNKCQDVIGWTSAEATALINKNKRIFNRTVYIKSRNSF